MNALVVGLVLAAAGSTDVEGALTADGLLVRTPGAGSVSAAGHGRVDLSRDFGRFFVEGRASVLITGGAGTLGLRDLGSRLALGYRPSGFVERVSSREGATQQLSDPQRLGFGKRQAMGWVDLQARVRLRDVRLFLTGRVQSVTPAVFDLGGLPPSIALADDQQTAPLVAGFLGADWTLRALKLTPGVLLRATRPGWIRTRFVSGGNNPPPGLGETIYVLPNGWMRSLGGKTVAPLLSATLSLRWEVASFASLLPEVDVEKDLNDHTVPPSDPRLPAASPAEQLTLRGQLLLRARF